MSDLEPRTITFTRGYDLTHLGGLDHLKDVFHTTFDAALSQALEIGVVLMVLSRAESFPPSKETQAYIQRLIDSSPTLADSFQIARAGLKALDTQMGQP